jgi:hypothetical protein
MAGVFTQRPKLRIDVWRLGRGSYVVLYKVRGDSAGFYVDGLVPCLAQRLHVPTTYACTSTKMHINMVGPLARGIKFTNTAKVKYYR